MNASLEDTQKKLNKALKRNLEEGTTKAIAAPAKLVESDTSKDDAITNTEN